MLPSDSQTISGRPAMAQAFSPQAAMAASSRLALASAEQSDTVNVTSDPTPFLVETRGLVALDQDLAHGAELLKDALGGLEALQARCEDVFGRPSTLVDEVVGPRLGALLRSSLAGLGQRPRGEILTALDEVMVSVSRAGLSKYIPTTALLETTLQALVRYEDDLRLGPPGDHSLRGYRQLRAELPKAPLAFLAAQTCLRLDPSLSHQPGETQVLEGVARQLAALPSDLSVAIRAFDLRRVERPIAFIEAWWGSVMRLDDPLKRLAALRESRLLEALREESALERFRLELELQRTLFGEDPAVATLIERVSGVQRQFSTIAEDEARAYETVERAAP